MAVNGVMQTEVIGKGDAATATDPDALESGYLQLLHLVERLHRQLLDVIKDELERLGQTDINSVQALLLYNIGDAELTPGELRSRGHYLGSNVSYNLKQLVGPRLIASRFKYQAAPSVEYLYPLNINQLGL